MTVAWWPLLLTLASSAAWSGFDVFRKQLVQRVEPAALAAWFSFLQVPLFVLLALGEPPPVLGLAYAYPALASVAVNVLANVLFLEAVRRSPLSVTVPLLGLTPAFAAVIGMPVLGELPTARQLGGIALVVVGAFWLNATLAELERPWRLFRALTRERGAVMMIAVALLWALTPMLDKLAIAHVGVAAHAGLLSAGVGLGLMLYLAISGRLGSMKAAWPVRRALTFAALTAGVALALQLLAIKILYVSLFEGIKRGVGMSLSVLAGRLIFNESLAPMKIIAIAIMTAGVALLV